MIGNSVETLPVYEGEVPKDQEIPKVNGEDLDSVLRYIRAHFDEFDYDFTDENVSDDEKKTRETKVIQAICDALHLIPDDPLVPKYLEAVLDQFKKGVKYDELQQPRVSGRVMRGAQANQLRSEKRGGI